MREKLGLSGKMGVYGRSLGGIPTTHLSDRVDMIIADRTFSDFDTLAYRKFYNPISKVLFKIGTCSWRASNYRSLVDKGKDSCYKVHMTDKNDDIVDLHSSLMMGVAREVFFRLHNGGPFFLSKQEIQGLIKDMQFVNNLEHDLYTVIEHQSQKQDLNTDENELSTSGFLYCCGSKYATTSRSHHKTQIQPDLERNGSMMSLSDTS